jgi:hypothetical protein
MIAQSIRFKGHRCFRDHFVGFDEIRPINIMIGKNNSGKSQMLDLVETLCASNTAKRGWRCEVHAVFDEASLQRAFPANTSGGALGGNHWQQHGCLFVGKNVRFTLNEKGQIDEFDVDNAVLAQQPGRRGAVEPMIREARVNGLRQAASTWTHPLGGRTFIRLAAERNIRPEPAVPELRLTADGSGATNIIRRYLNSASLDRSLVKESLLGALNQVFGSDGTFTEIETKEYDDGPTEVVGKWEIYLGEEKKGLIPLSSSGSGLKTIILVLLSLLVLPEIMNQQKSACVFGLEELENNLHPGLLRRLLRFVESYAAQEKAVFFLTTHSSVALDLFGISSNAQLIHVSHDGVSAAARRVGAHLDRLGVISELGAKPSDLLQANGVIWVEGPSDRIYISHWIELFSNEKFREGRDYQCAFYGGSLLAQMQIATEESAVRELVNLFMLNRNIAVICDGDRTAETGEGAKLKGRVARIQAEVEKIPLAHIWITAGKEIENYLPGNVIGKAFEKPNVRSPNQYERFFASESKEAKTSSYIESELERKSMDKVELANRALPLMNEVTELATRFDLADQVKKLINCIREWNR